MAAISASETPVADTAPTSLTDQLVANSKAHAKLEAASRQDADIVDKAQATLEQYRAAQAAQRDADAVRVGICERIASGEMALERSLADADAEYANAARVVSKLATPTQGAEAAKTKAQTRIAERTVEFDLLRIERTKLVRQICNAAALASRRAYNIEAAKFAREAFARHIAEVQALGAIARSSGIDEALAVTNTSTLCVMPSTSVWQWSNEPGQSVREQDVVQVNVSAEVTQAMTQAEVRLRVQLGLVATK